MSKSNWEKYPELRTVKNSWKNDLDDLIGNYSQFAEEVDFAPGYTWFDVLYTFVKQQRKDAINQLLEKAKEKKQNILKGRVDYDVIFIEDLEKLVKEIE